MVENKPAGIVLAGGESSRMGRDKGLIPWQGRTLIENAIEILSPLCAEIILSSNSNNYEHLGHRVVSDDYPGCGPMGGILTCLHLSRGARNLVIPVDTPFVTTELYRKLLRMEEPCDLIIPVDHESWYQPLCAVFHKSILPAMEEQVRNRILGFTPLIRKVVAKEIHFKPGEDEYSRMTFFNINSPADLVSASRFS